jgi:FKBP-type peptidyl-prolyl cis-trans isomerase
MAETDKKSPKSVLNMIMAAIRSQPATLNGVSRAAIVKYLKAELQYNNASKIKQAMKKGVGAGTLVQTGQSFRIAGDPIPERAPEPIVDITDTEIGSGTQEASVGDTVIVSYQGKLSNGTMFDSASKFEFTLGAGEVIKGWDMGIVGMKIGGIRNLLVPAVLGYGKRGAAPEIPPNADLFFTVRLKEIK